MRKETGDVVARCCNVCEKEEAARKLDAQDEADTKGLYLGTRFELT